MNRNSFMKIKTWYYRHFDADFGLDVPAEGYGGWKSAELPIDPRHTALVVMHAWDSGTREQFPGWHRFVEYMPRAERIVREVFPPLLAAVRRSPIPLFHVVGGGDYYKSCPGYRRAVELAGPELLEPPRMAFDPIVQALSAFRHEHVSPGVHNADDIQRGFARLDFPEPARPVGDEGVAENAHQLFALCRHHEVTHLVYVGFAINWCLLLSPGGMADMSRRGLMCSAIRQAVTAVENKETARDELCKQIALWRVALAFGFVYDLDDFLAMLGSPGSGD